MQQITRFEDSYVKFWRVNFDFFPLALDGIHYQSEKLGPKLDAACVVVPLISDAKL